MKPLGLQCHDSTGGKLPHRRVRLHDASREREPTSVLPLEGTIQQSARPGLPTIRAVADPWDQLQRLNSGARADLLRVLTAPSNVRADVIRQLWERDEGRGMAETLMDLEEDERLRAAVVEVLLRLAS
jgi:hypothetical protein